MHWVDSARTVPSPQDDAARPGFACGVCGQWHDRLPFSYSVKVPFAVAAIPAEELDRRVVFTLDQCVIDDRDFYLRGSIPIPVWEKRDPFIWGVWARVSRVDFARTNELWKVKGREAAPAYPGWLDTKIPLYGETLYCEILGLEVRVLTQVVGQRPHFELADAAHPLAVEQREGIFVQRVRDIAEAFLHPRADRRFGT